MFKLQSHPNMIKYWNNYNQLWADRQIDHPNQCKPFKPNTKDSGIPYPNPDQYPSRPQPKTKWPQNYQCSSYTKNN